jgi:LPXTG-motif cell wall-anchored protein
MNQELMAPAILGLVFLGVGLGMLVWWNRKRELTKGL